MNKLLTIIFLILSISINAQVGFALDKDSNILVSKDGVVLSLDPIPEILLDGYTSFWIRSDMPSNMLMDGSNGVYRWYDYLGSGRYLQQPESTFMRPLYTVDGIKFDGVNDYLSVFSSLVMNTALPTTVYIVVKPNTWVSGTYIFAPYNPENAFPYNITQIGTTPNIRYNRDLNNYTAESSDLTLGDFHIIILTSIEDDFLALQVDNNAILSQEFTSGNPNGSGLTLGRDAQQGGRCTDMTIREIIVRRNVIDNSTNQTIIYNYLKTKHGL